jgi:hypothetical protein
MEEKYAMVSRIHWIVVPRLTLWSLPNSRSIGGIRLKAEEERRPTRDDRRPFATSGVDVICVQKLYESNKRRNGRLNLGVQTR